MSKFIVSYEDKVEQYDYPVFPKQTTTTIIYDNIVVFQNIHIPDVQYYEIRSENYERVTGSELLDAYYILFEKIRYSDILPVQPFTLYSYVDGKAIETGLIDKKLFEILLSKDNFRLE